MRKLTEIWNLTNYLLFLSNYVVFYSKEICRPVTEVRCEKYEEDVCREVVERSCREVWQTECRQVMEETCQWTTERECTWKVERGEASFDSVPVRKEEDHIVLLFSDGNVNLMKACQGTNGTNMELSGVWSTPSTWRLR